MEKTPDYEKLLSSLKNVDLTDGVSLEKVKKFSEDLSALLTSKDGVSLFQQQKNFEVAFPLYVKVVFHPDAAVAQPCLKLSDVVLEVFKSKLPKIKKELWWKKFEESVLIKLLDSVERRIETNDDLWVALFTFACAVIISETLNILPLNRLLALSQYAFVKGKVNSSIKENAWLCWNRVIDAFARSPKSLVQSKTVDLLMRPLMAVSHQSESQISTWVHLVEAEEISGTGEILKIIIGKVCKTFYLSENKPACRAFPSACADALNKIISNDRVLEHCLSEIVEVFGVFISSKPSTENIVQLAGILVNAINHLSDDGKSYRLWKRLFDQYNACADSEIVSTACQKIFTDVKFMRWIESSTIEGKDLSATLMDSREFREGVLLRSIQALALSNDSGTPETPSKRKNKKGSCEDIWSSYCDAYISWWSNQSPPSSPKETEISEVIPPQVSSCDLQATQFLLIQPLKHNVWNSTLCKTWSLLCEACHRQKFLRTFVKDIFDSFDERNFPLQKAIDVADCLYKLDSDFCKRSVKLFETFCDVIWSMEFQNLTDVLSLSETAVLHPEMSSVVGKICKGANEKCIDYDQLNGHKIKTKVSKIMRKLEVISNSVEKEKPAKAQRTPFRTKSNFLQRLAKAEEKNKNKSPFLTSLFPSTDKAKVENDEDVHVDDVATLEDGLAADEKTVNDSEVVPMITLPSVLRGSPALVNGNAEGVVAEKENVMLSAINGSRAASPTVGSPKIKITNAREVKPVDSSSPVVAKKPKPVAGQKSTPKKVTPSKVSYFDDDANDYVMVPPKPKTTPLTEHQMEMMAKRRSDIPALYQDLSQDTQSQQVPDIQEVTTGVSPRPIQDSQDIVPGTPSPADDVPVSTPEPRKSSGRTCTSAKKLDFNSLSTPPSKKSLMNASIREISPAPDDVKSEGKNTPKQPDESTKEEPIVYGLDAKSLPANLKEADEGKQEPKPAGDEKLKRKRKSEPSKFSPKLTRSKKKQERSVTPDAKLVRLPERDSKVNVGVKSPELNLKPRSPSPVGRTDRSSSDVENAGKTEAAEGMCETSTQKDVEITSLEDQPEVPDVKPASQVLHESLEKPKKGRKRKVAESPKEETPKKAKISGEECSSAGKKSDSAKKKKKPFKLGTGGNLENWLVKTDRVPTPVPEPEVKCEKSEPLEMAIETKECVSVPMPSGTVEELDNSDEIVPSTQEGLMGEPVLPVLEVKSEAKCEHEEVIEVDKEYSKDAVPDEAGSRTPEKPEGSVLERLAHESPNDDDIALVISPSKRQRRAPSVFRGEGDTYLSKERFYSTESEEDSKASSRAKNKAASPTSKKRLQPLGGRSAKMIRLATSSCAQEDNEDVVVTPVRRRESIVPVKYGENWPKGPVEDWVACTPASPYMSPFRSALKKTPLEYNATRQDESATPLRIKNDSMASPLLSSAKRKRVVFLDPPVTRGLAYDTESPGGSIHHADVPQGSPYPTWKGDDVGKEISPSKRDAERLSSLADLRTDKEQPVSVQEEPSPSQHSKEITKPQADVKPYAASDVSDEVRQLIVSEEPTTVPSPEPKINQLQDKFKLTDDFVTEFSKNDPHLQSLLTTCFECSSMAETVDAWKVRDCRRICKLPFAFLFSVKNSNGELLTDSLASLDITAPSNKTTEFAESSAQTEHRSLSDNSCQTHSPQLGNSESQTDVKELQNAETNTETSTASSATQADWKRPSTEDWPRLLQDATPQEAVLYFSDSLRVLSSSLPKKN